MGLRIGIVGLPNVGKSTLFNALTAQAAAAQNFPFTTIAPNVGVVPVPDERLEQLARISKSAKITPTTIEFVDIAGLVKNAHAGEGLGNKFLSHIREVDAIIHVVRFFEDPTTIHVANKVDPVADAETIETELALADLATVEKARQRAEHEAKGNNKEAQAILPLLKKLERHVAAGKQARDLTMTPEEEILLQLSLLTRKPVLYIANVSEAQISTMAEATKDFAAKYAPVVPLAIKIEQELIQLSADERQTFLAEYGLTQTGLARLIQASYQVLGLITFLTTGPTESRAWTITHGSTAPQAAGKIHSDMERGFIRAETIACRDLVTAGSYAAARAAGKVRDEGKEYVVHDGDVMLFKFSV
ncbi:MAG: redox-regulated ATPase YchF [Candidatus Andersenbacteria bacterium]